MISLLLTLFISLFSIGSSINTIDDHIENNIVINEEKPINNRVLVENQYVAYGVDEFANEPFYNQLFTLYSSYTDNFTTGWHSLDYCDLSMSRNIAISTPLTDNTTNFLVQRRVIDYDDFIFTLCYSTNIVNNARQYYGFVVGKHGNGTDQYTYLAWGVEFVNSETNPTNINYLYFFNTNNINLGLCVYLPALYLSSDDLVLYNGLYTGFVNQEGLYNDVASAYTDGYNTGYDTGFTDGESKGYQTGYDDGLVHADYDSTALTIFTGVTEIGLLPVNVFLRIFEFEVFGINISGLVGGLLTIAVVVIIIRFLLGEKNK